MKFLTLLFTLTFSLAIWAEAPCQCAYSTSPGAQPTYVDPGDYTFQHSYGGGGECSATCNAYPSGSCGWINKSSGCYGAIADNQNMQQCRLEKIDGVECVICNSVGVTCNWQNRENKDLDGNISR